MGKADDGLRGLLHKHLPRVHWQAIETAMTGGGVPDTNACCDGVEFWVECKATSTHAVKFQPLQPAWISRRVRQGGRVVVATRRRHAGGPRLGAAVDELWVHSGRHVFELRDLGLRGVPTLTDPMCGGPSRWDWDLLLGVMMREAL